MSGVGTKLSIQNPIDDLEQQEVVEYRGHRKLDGAHGNMDGKLVDAGHREEESFAKKISAKALNQIPYVELAMERRVERIKIIATAIFTEISEVDTTSSAGSIEVDALREYFDARFDIGHRLDTVFGDVDKDGSGTIDLAEFLVFVTNVVRGNVAGTFDGLYKDVAFMAGVAYLIGGVIFTSSATKGLLEAEGEIGGWKWSTYLGSWLYSLGGLAFFHLSFQARMAQAAVKRDAQRLLYNEMLSVHTNIEKGYDTTGDGKVDAWDTTADGKIDAWDTNGDGIADMRDLKGDGKADTRIHVDGM